MGIQLYLVLSYYQLYTVAHDIDRAPMLQYEFIIVYSYMTAQGGVSLPIQQKTHVQIIV